MHRTSLLSLTALTLAFILFTPSLQKYEDDDISTLLTNVDITEEELYRILAEREKELLSQEEVAIDSSSEFFVKFSEGSRLHQLMKDGPSDRDTLIEKVNALSQQYKKDLIAGEFDEFKKAVKIPIRNYLVIAIMNQDSEVSYQDLVINLKNNLKTITNTKDDIVAESLVKTYKVSINSILDEVENALLDFSTYSHEKIMGEALYKLTVDTCTSSDKDFSFARSRRQAIYDTLQKYDLQANSVDFISSYLGSFLENQESLYSEWSTNKECRKFMDETINSIAPSASTHEDILNVIDNILTITFDQKSLGEEFMVGFDNFIRARQERNRSDFSGLLSEDEVIRNMSAVHFIEFATNTFVTYRNTPETFDNKPSVYLIDERAFKTIISHFPIIVEQLYGNYQDVSYIFSTFLNDSLELNDKTNFESLVAFHNATLLAKVVPKEAENDDEPNYGAERSDLYELVEKIINEDFDGSLAAKRGLSANGAKEFKKYFDIDSKNKYAFLITLILFGTEKYSPTFVENGYDYQGFVNLINKIAKEKRPKAENDEDLYKLIEENQKAGYRPDFNYSVHNYLTHFLVRLNNFHPAQSLGDIPFETFKQAIGSPVDRTKAVTKFDDNISRGSKSGTSTPRNEEVE